MFYRSSDGMTGRDFGWEIYETFSVIIFVALIQKWIWEETVTWNQKVSFRYSCCFREKVLYSSYTIWEVIGEARSVVP